jgi:hypothetical protein
MRLSPLVLCLLLPFSADAESTSLEVKVPAIKAKNRQKVWKDAKPSLDDTGRRLVLAAKAKEAAVTLSYDRVTKVVIEADFRVTYGPAAALAGFAVGGPLFGGSLAAKISNPAKAAHTVYLEHRLADGSEAAIVFSIGESDVPRALPRIRTALGERVTLVGFGETPAKLEKGRFWRHREWYGVRADPGRHPLPELRQDEALVVVACPTGNGLDATPADEFVTWAAHVEVNDRVVAVNGPGTYSFFSLDPGDALLVSHAVHAANAMVPDPGEATGLRLAAEAGKDYYLVHTMYIAGNFESFLTHHSKELVMHEIRNLHWAEWKRVEGK